MAEKLYTVERLTGGKDDNVPRIQVTDVINAVNKLKPGKSRGIDGLQGEHYKYASDRLYVLLTLCLNAMLIHGYMSHTFMKTVLLPIVKDKNEDLSSVENYRPIALTTSSSKILELIYLDKLSDTMECNYNQFGFKSSHSTDMCIYVLKQIIGYYTECNSPLYVTYLDASKAFDRVNFHKLFNKLLDRGVPSVYVRLLLFWYTHQEFIVRWGNTYSNSFLVNNGVRQGGVLSPVLFNVYMDDLSSVLNSLNVGCYLNGTMLNHLMYADDVVIMAPSTRSMQILLSHCDKYADMHDIIFHTRKSKCMYFKPKVLHNVAPKLFLSSVALNFVDTHCYLGVTLCTNMSDDLSIEKQCKNLYARGNLLLRHFRNCSDNVKKLLFTSYCTSFYGSSLWHNFRSDTRQCLKTAYNRIFRLLFNVRGPISVSQCLINLNLNPFTVILRKSILSLRTRVFKSENQIVSVIVNSMFSMFSKLHKHWDQSLFLL